MHFWPILNLIWCLLVAFKNYILSCDRLWSHRSCTLIYVESFPDIVINSHWPATLSNNLIILHARLAVSVAKWHTELTVWPYVTVQSLSFRKCSVRLADCGLIGIDRCRWVITHWNAAIFFRQSLALPSLINLYLSCKAKQGTAIRYAVFSLILMYLGNLGNLAFNIHFFGSYINLCILRHLGHTLAKLRPFKSFEARSLMKLSIWSQKVTLRIMLGGAADLISPDWLSYGLILHWSFCPG